MISLDLDLSYLCSQYNIGISAMQQYQDMSVVQIMQTEAAKGNTAAAKFMLQITTNPEELAKVFQLINPKNRYLILMNMNQNDLMMIMEYLDPKEMVLGLSIFTHDALIKLMQNLPPESLATVVLSTMDSNKFLNSIPEKYIHWDWMQTLYAVFNCCLSYYFLFVIGVFLGVILGNLFTGPMIIAFVALLYTLFQQSIAFYPHWEDWLGTAVHDAAFNGMHPKQIILYALLIAAFLFLSNHLYQQTL